MELASCDVPWFLQLNQSPFVINLFPLKDMRCQFIIRSALIPWTNNGNNFKHGMVEWVVLGNIECYVTPKKTFWHNFVNLVLLLNHRLSRRLPPSNLSQHKERWECWGARCCGMWARGLAFPYSWETCRYICGLKPHFFHLISLLMHLMDWFACGQFLGLMLGKSPLHSLVFWQGGISNNWFRETFPCHITCNSSSFNYDSRSIDQTPIVDPMALAFWFLICVDCRALIKFVNQWNWKRGRARDLEYILTKKFNIAWIKVP